LEQKSQSKLDLHFLEEKFMISPLKKFMLSYFELKVFKSFLKSIDIPLEGKNILEVGCGAGYGLVQIYEDFKPKEYYAFDINPKMVAISRKRVENHNLPIQLFVGDVRDLELPSDKFDLVFIFTVLHHVEGWPNALKEINRVIKPRGLLLVDEINNRSLNWFERYLKVYHPRKARFTWPVFRSGLSNAGFKILREFRFLGDLGFFLCTKVS
jgi:ubiquinone/menaquinone biosynthesis C-methylase UbiE